MYKLFLVLLIAAVVVYSSTKSTEGFLVDSDNLYYPNSIFLLKRGDKFIGTASDSSLTLVPDAIYADVFRKIGCGELGCNIRSYTHDIYWSTKKDPGESLLGNGNLTTVGNVVMSGLPDTLNMIFSLDSANECYIRETSSGLFLKEDLSGYLYFNSKEPVPFEIVYLK